MRAEMEESDVAPTVDQHFFLVHRMDKPRVLARILQSPDRGGVYVFTRTKNMADRLVNDLEELQVSAIAIHGDLRQTTREKNLDRFREGKADVLVATEVAARGLDVDNVSHVVNYDCPDDEKMYLHRIGRTARKGNKGVAITFAQFNEVDRLNVIRKAVQATENQIEEVFSTSDRLQELFDLPDERPWDHLSKKARSNGGGSKSSKSSNGGSRSGRGGDRKRDDDDSGRGGSRRGSSDGRSKNSRSAEGKGERSSSTRDRSRDASPRDGRGDSPARDQERTRDEKPTRETASSKPASEDQPTRERGSSRTRTRTRARTRTEDRSGGRGGDTDASSSTPEPSKPEPSKSASGGRTRARAPKSAGESGEPERTSGKDERPARSSSSRSGSSRSTSGSDDDRSRRGGRERSSRGGEDRASEPIPGTEPTTRGEDARGDGTPQLARRVKVEHLP